MSVYYDANIIASEVARLPPDLAGGIVSGPGAAEICARLKQQSPAHAWHYAAELAHLVGVDDPRFPNSTPAPVRIDLQLGDIEAALRGPNHAWFALAETATARQQFIRLKLPPGTSAVAPLRRLAAKFPRTRFWIDPFRHGPDRSWEAQVRTADLDNIWLSTLGLPGVTWSEGQARAAIHFTMGEVGASKLLFASGSNLQPAAYDLPPAAWLLSLNVLDAEQQQLVLRANFEELFGPGS